MFRLNVFNERFAREVIEMSEWWGLWGPGGYEPVLVNRSGVMMTETHPTVDIQFEQMGMFEPYMQIIHHFVFRLLDVIYPQNMFDATLVRATLS